ncbi:hypothetical protein BC941DRAFT_431684 [Chlamydoabsidia padenii]|nr:hypothetical protein BC941DRAFT_431684 [Chlamydoabsidia padenii]
MTGMFSLKDRRKSSNTPHMIHPVSSHRTSYVKSKPHSSSSTSMDYGLLPKKIIKANLSYTAQSQHELSFEKGDFFHVVGRENDHHWYAVNNPLTNLQGLVPVSYFQVVDKNTRTMNVIQPTLPLGHQIIEKLGDASKRSSLKQQQYYGRVLYDFVAERLDELDCKADEAIIVIAQSNKEWYVAKPIGRLGGPGLIPVSYVQLYDVITNHPISSSTITRSTVSSPGISTSISIPNLDEWKQQTQIYETSSILLVSSNLGTAKRSSTSMSKCLSDQHHLRHSSTQRLEQQQVIHPTSSSRLSSESVNHISPRRNSEFVVVKNSSAKVAQPTLADSLDRTIVVDITVNSFIMEGDQYWFVLYATANNGKHRILYRTYERFYQFHIRLLQEYPEEAGKGDKERILPFMPGPLDYVNDLITEQRREDLDHYCKTLLSLPDYLSTCDLIQYDLFGLDQNDVETDYAPKKGSRVIKSDTGEPTGNKGMDTYYNGGVGKVKIKIVHKDDIFAVKIPADCTLQELVLRVKDRLGQVPGKMKYKDDTHYSNDTYLSLETELDMEEAFILAIQRGKLTIVVE